MHVLYRGLFAITLSLPLWAVAADDDPDATFYRKATESGLAEIDGGMLAQRQGTSKTVISFGEMMVKDHTLANHQLRDLAVDGHVDLPTQASAEQTSKQAALKTLSGDAFDKSYIEWQILSHRDAIALFKEESASGDDLAAKRFATSVLPTLESHLRILMSYPVIAPASPAPAATQ